LSQAPTLHASLALGNRAVLGFLSLAMLLPTALFAAAFKPLPAAVLTLGVLGSLAILNTRGAAAEGALLDRKVDAAKLFGFILFAGLLLVLGGSMHYLYAPLDWRIRDAVLADLLRDAMPAYDLDGVEYLMRAPLGMYLVPATLGKIFGLGGAHVALWLQNSLVLGSIFYLFAQLGRGVGQVLVMVVFGGAAIFGIALMSILAGAPDLDRFQTYGLDIWHPAWQYSASLIQFHWAPNHALPGWWLAAMMLLHARREIDTPTLACAVVAAMFWSPLCVVPALLWALLWALVEIRRHLTSARSWVCLLSGICFLPVVLYVTSNAQTIAHGGGPATEQTNGGVWVLLYALFAAAHAPYIFFVLRNRAMEPRAIRPLLLFCAVLLACLPFVHFGPSNDLAMRGSISAMTVMAFAFGDLLLQGMAIGRRAFAVGCGLLVAATPAAAVEWRRAFALPAYAASACTLTEASRALGTESVPTNYIVQTDAAPLWLLNESRKSVNQLRRERCWADQDATLAIMAAAHKSRLAREK
jgi:hypothetical protein